MNRKERRKAEREALLALRKKMLAAYDRLHEITEFKPSDTESYLRCVSVERRELLREVHAAAYELKQKWHLDFGV